MVWVTRGRLVDSRHASSPGPRPAGGALPGPRGLTACTADDASDAAAERRRLLARRGGPDAWPTPWPSGDFADVGFTDADPAGRRRGVRRHRRGPRGPDADGHAGRRHRADAGEPATATATYDWTWPIGPDGWSYSSRGDADPSPTTSGWPSGTPPTIEPSLARVGHPRPGRPAAPSAATSSAPAAWPWSPTGRWCASASTAARCGAAKAGASARELARLVDIDAAAYAKRVEAAGDRWPSSRRSSTARTRCRAACCRGVRRDQGRASAIAGELPLAPTKELRRADPRHGRRGDRRDDRGEPRRLPGRRRRGPVRAPGAVRRAAARHARPGASTRSAPTARTRELFRVDAGRRAAARS